jgi:transcriptional regulator with AAA-type ATPase domain
MTVMALFSGDKPPVTDGERELWYCLQVATRDRPDDRQGSDANEAARLQGSSRSRPEKDDPETGGAPEAPSGKRLEMRPTAELQSSSTGPHALVQRFQLLVTGGPDRSVQCHSSGRRLVIGTQPTADLVLHDRTVSRFHCEIAIEEGRAVARDLGSRNGTFVDGVSIVHAHLRSGATIRIGQTEIGFRLSSDHVKIPLFPDERFGTMVGKSVAMRAAFVWLDRAAASEATVLLEGETGTGKEAAAESIHSQSSRREGPFVVVDCSAIPPDLLESELFGHEKGAFTGAVAPRQGAFRAATSGTIFLDEIGELSQDLQPKLLRVLERREIKAVGTDHYEPIDVRVVAATNRNLQAEVNARRFRSDLYYRLAVLQVRLPPLRERPEDLPPLVENILASLGAGDRPEAAQLRTREFIDGLAQHAWPGNVRELRNYVERCLAFRGEAPPLSPEAAAQGARFDPNQPFKIARDAFERYYIDQMLKLHEGNVTAAARAAQIDRAFFYRLLWRYGLR